MFVSVRRPGARPLRPNGPGLWADRHKDLAVTPSSSTLTAVDAATMLPDLLRAAPHLRPIFDRYGLRGCGGPHGPAETVRYFARAHGVDEPTLLRELNDALDRPAATAAGAPQRHPLDELADTIYRRFFKAGIVVILTAGAVWGAYLLLQIALRGSFTAVSIHDVNAHGHAQILGWMGLFVMGFAYQALPRMKHTSLWRPDLANFTFYLMLFGIFARVIAEPLHATSLMLELAVAAGLAEIAAIGLFVAIVVNTLIRSGKRLEAPDGYVLAALGFFLLQAVGETALVYATITATDREALLAVIGTWQGALRNLQIHGFGLLIILGVGLRMFPALFGLHRPGARLQRLALPVLVAAVVSEAVSLVLMQRTLEHAWAGPLYAATLAIAGLSIALTFRWGLLARPTERDRSVKFIRAAVLWLHTSMVLLLLAPLHMLVVLPNVALLSESGRHAAEIGFSHAYWGAVRHAVTVGFVSLTILGMAAKVVPTLNGVDIRRLRPLWPPFVLVNLGCALRVGLQIATDFAAWAFPLVGISGVLEVCGIALWGVHLWRIMAGWRPAEAPAVRPTRITAEHAVGQVIEWFPATLEVLLARGFTPLANPLLRKTLARAVSLRAAAARQDVDLGELLAALNEAAFGGSAAGERAEAATDGPRRLRLPVLQES